MHYRLVRFENALGGVLYKVRTFRGFFPRWLRGESGEVMTFGTKESAHDATRRMLGAAAAAKLSTRKAAEYRPAPHLAADPRADAPPM